MLQARQRPFAMRHLIEHLVHVLEDGASLFLDQGRCGAYVAGEHNVVRQKVQRELQLSPTQTVPWHFHTNIADTFYVLAGEMRLFLQDPKQEVRLKPGETFVAAPGRPHLVTNAGTKSLTFLIMQGVGEYDYVPLVTQQAEAS